MQDLWTIYLPEMMLYGTMALIVLGSYVLLMILVIYGFISGMRKFMDPVDGEGNRIAWPRCPLCQKTDKVKIDLPASGAFCCKRCGHNFTFKPE